MNLYKTSKLQQFINKKAVKQAHFNPSKPKKEDFSHLNQLDILKVYEF